MNYLKLPLENYVLNTIATNAKDYALTNGITMKSPKFPTDVVIHAPFCLFPSSFSKKCFEKVKQIQTEINLLIHKVAHDFEFLKECLESTKSVDEFTSKLFDIYETIKNEGQPQPLSLGLLRSDYMMEEKDLSIKQIEINTIASSFAGLVTKLGSLHKYTLNQLNTATSQDSFYVPPNKAVDGLAEGLVTAWKAYNNTEAVLMFVVEETVLNMIDQRLLEFSALAQAPSCSVIFKTLHDLQTQSQLEEGLLIVDGYEVAVVYFRVGYSPEQYGDQDWAVRLLIERSKAIKCPSIQYHLAGTKKVQQELTRPGVLEKYVSDPYKLELIRETFAAQYSLDMTEEGDLAASLGIKDPNKYVLKPQREGGGHNIYGNDIKVFLEEKTEERQAYILMERINPPSIQNYIIRQGQEPTFTKVVCELGVYGIILASSEKVILNKEVGHLLRSKVDGTEEGGVAAGYGVLDNPLFCTDQDTL